MESIADIDESNGDLPVPSASPIANANGEKQDNNDVKNRDEKDKQEMIESIEDNIKNEDEISKKKDEIDSRALFHTASLCFPYSLRYNY